MTLKRKILIGIGAFFALIIVIAIAAPPVEDDEAVETTTTTETPATTEAPATTERETTTTTAEDVTIEPQVLFDLTMSVVANDALLNEICPLYSTLDRTGREAIIATTFTPEQDLSIYEGWDADDMTNAAADYFDGQCL